MGILDDTALFAAVIQNGGFSHAANHLGLSNGLISRRIAQLETKLGVTLIKRTTRQIQLTSEGELFWQHAQRIQQELNSALTIIHASAKKPKGTIRVSGPLYFGRQYLAPIIMKFLKNFSDITIDLDLSNQRLDLIKEKIDLVIRGAGFIDPEQLKVSNLRAKLLIKDNIGLYASTAYLQKHGEPKNPHELSKHAIIGYVSIRKNQTQEKWCYSYKNNKDEIALAPNFKCNDIEGNIIACTSGFGIGKFTGLSVKKALEQNELHPILMQYDWGHHNLYAIYSNQQNLPQRTRLLLDFICTHVQGLLKNSALDL